MNQIVTSEIREVIDAVHYRPAVSIIMPMIAHVNLTTELTRTLHLSVDKVKLELKKNFPEDNGKLVIQKLNEVIENLKIDTTKKSIAIFVSPVYSNVFFLDIDVEEKIVIDESFGIRDLLYSKKQLLKYLVVMASSKESHIFLCNSDTFFVRILANKAESVDGFVNDIAERVLNFSDISERKEIMMDKFLHHLDHELGNILKTYNLPVFLVGTDRILGHFRKLTKYEAAIVSYIHGNYEEASMNELKGILAAHIDILPQRKQNAILDQLEEAANRNKLAVGMKEVWKEASNQKGRVLVVEKNFKYTAEHGDKENVIHKVSETSGFTSYIRDTVDDVIEKVLEFGGDIEFVDDDLLKRYDRIALIQYF